MNTLLLLLLLLIILFFVSKIYNCFKTVPKFNIWYYSSYSNSLGRMLQYHVRAISLRIRRAVENGSLARGGSYTLRASLLLVYFYSKNWVVPNFQARGNYLPPFSWSTRRRIGPQLPSLFPPKIKILQFSPGVFKSRSKFFNFYTTICMFAN